MTKIQAIRGMNDVLPDETPLWQWMEATVQRVVSRYGYREIRFPVLEQTQLFTRSIGAVTDIVEKEMYSFDDRNGDNLSLRPEGTAVCVRAAEQHGLLYNQQQRLWYKGPMFRHERPQKGRYRQFHQLGVEAYGMSGPDIDAEVILLSARLLQELGLGQAVSLQINNIGSAEDRQQFGAALLDYLRGREEELDADSRRRLQANPLRILDSKAPQTQAVLKEAPLLAQYLSPESQVHYEELKLLLQATGVQFEENPLLVRGLDYYNNAVFEWVTSSLGAQGTVCAGGRYDTLVEKLGGRPNPAVGFAIGLERLILLLQTLTTQAQSLPQPADVSLVVDKSRDMAAALALAERMRTRWPELKVLCHCGGGKVSTQLKKAYNDGSRLAVIYAEASTGDSDRVRLRRLDETGEQWPVEVSDLMEQLEKELERF
ncbi:MAG: histidine--tRNA ligase [Pseudomonadales bacterium]|nr:histidine--tRNA ligase [Pseudomonadales bacterium]